MKKRHKFYLLLLTITIFIEVGIWLLNLTIYGLLLSRRMLPSFILSLFVLCLSSYTLILRFTNKKKFFNWSIASIWAWIIATILFSLSYKNYAGLSIILIGAFLWTFIIGILKKKL